MRLYALTDESRNRIEKAFTYYKPNKEQPERYEHLRSAGRALACDILRLTKPSREQSLALTKLEEVIFWANAAIARNESDEESAK